MVCWKRMILGIIVNTREIVLFGCGEVAKRHLPLLCRDFRIPFIIDNDKQKQGTEYEGIKICSFEEAEEKLNGKKIVVTAGTNIHESIRLEISNFLRGKGWTEYEDFCVLEDFITEWYWRFEKRAIVFKMHTAITTKCTLKCKHCNMFIPYYKKAIEYTADEMKDNLSLLFRYVDYVCCYQLVGGEPFINNDLESILDVIGGIYGDKILWKRIVTNGTVIPNAAVLNKLREYDFQINISDYSAQIPYGQKIIALEKKLDEYGISHHKDRSQTWLDIGVPFRMEKRPIETVKAHMNVCGSSWHGLVDRRLYYCNVAWSAEKCGFYTNCEGDFIDLDQEIDKEEMAEQILNICKGEYGNGINSFCQYCGGCGLDNDKTIPAGEQCGGRPVL